MRMSTRLRHHPRLHHYLNSACETLLEQAFERTDKGCPQEAWINALHEALIKHRLELKKFKHVHELEVILPNGMRTITGATRDTCTSCQRMRATFRFADY